MKEIENFSYFKRGVTNVIPLMEVSLHAVYGLINSTRLKEVTCNIRKGVADKTKDLPSACFSGTFKSRGIAGLLTYSGLICLDVDELDFAQSLKEKLSKDTFLNPVLMFISPRGRGLKIVIRVKDSRAEKHGLYFDALARYLKGTYGVEIDPSGRDVSRLCFICWDPAPYYYEDGGVDEIALLRLLPKTMETPNVASSQKAMQTTNGEAKYRVSTGSDLKPSEQLNHIPEVHDLAENALRNHGWKQKGKLWTRPGKELRQGCSSIYNLYGPQGVYIMTNFSSNASPFVQNKSYSDCQIICELEYHGDFKKCISELANRYLDRN